jgi:UDP-N-acetylmuramoyl-tripeptide--D-alanyl-D-alanine ligase
LRHATGAKVLATPANENNEIGVAKLLLDADADTDYLVVEMGARHYGEIETLTRAALPDVAVLTNIGEAHLEIFGTRERLAETKWGIFATRAHPVLNLKDEESRARASSLAEKASWFCGAGPLATPSGKDLQVRLLVWLPEVQGKLLILRPPAAERRFDVRPPIDGAHNAANLAAAITGAIALGVEPDDVVNALRDLTLPPGRYERIDFGSFTLIYDAYNASMTGMLSALGSFSSERSLSRRIAVLASMAELGDQAPDMHRKVGNCAGHSRIAVLLVGGDYARDIAVGAREAGMDPEHIVSFVDNAMAVDWLKSNTRAGDLVLLKGSRRYHLEEIVEGLRA